jgi:hypothetical protein
MFDAFTQDMLNELEQHLAASLETAPGASWKGDHIVRALQTCLKDVVTEMSQNSDMHERQSWRSVYLGIESMVTVMDWLNSGVPPRPTDLQF